MFRDVIADARRGPAGDRLDVASEPIIAVVGVKFGHGQQMTAEVLRQIPADELSLPAIERLVYISDRPPEGLGEFRRDGPHVLRARPGQLVDLTDMVSRAFQDGCDD